jgi:hypothetical protein
MQPHKPQSCVGRRMTDGNRFLPFAALITPSTLTVVLSSNETSSMQHVPTIDFYNSSLYEFSGLGDGTSPLLTRITSAVATSMDVLPMRAIGENTTYTHQFVGPSWKCGAVDSGWSLDNMSAVLNYTRNLTNANRVVYLAYSLPDPDSALYNRLYNHTFDANKTASDCVLSGARNGCPSSSYPVTHVFTRNESVECILYTTRFNLSFQAMGNVQTIKDLKFDRLSKFNWTEKYQPNPDFRIDHVYSYMLQALATLLNGAITIEISGELTQTSNRRKTSLQTYRTRVATTSLIGKVPTGYTLEDWTTTSEIPLRDRQLVANRTLAEMLEELSRNQTLSLFSSDRFWSV